MPDSHPLTGRCVLITGGAKRLGAAITRMLHCAGANVAVHFRQSGAEAMALAGDLDSIRPGSAMTLAADLGDIATMPGLIESVIARFGRLDVLINNASSFYPTPVGSISALQWDDLVGTNLRAPLFLAQAAADSLRATEGCIINMADIHGQKPLKHHPVYSAAKAGLIMLTRSLAQELGPAIRVNAIAPGPVLWPEAGLPDELKQEIIAKTALKRTGAPEDIARTALFLAAYAPYITGQVIAVDGGRNL
jgi:pteridine reductase